MGRKKDYTVLSGYKILCSLRCQEIDNDESTKEEDNTALIEKLRTELCHKDLHINRLKRASEDFEAAAVDSEERIAGRVDELNLIVSDLKGRLNELVQRNNELSLELQGQRAVVARLEAEKGELGRLHKSMLISIETLSVDNDAYRNEVKELKSELCLGRKDGGVKIHRCAEGIDQGNQEDIVVVADNGRQAKGKHVQVVLEDFGDSGGLIDSSRMPVKPSTHKKNKLLILCDHHGAALRRLLYLRLDNYIIQAIIKPNAGYCELIEDIVTLAKDYTVDDHIVILAGPSDFHRRKYPLFKTLNDKLRHCTHTNLHLFSCPYLTKNVNLNKFVYKFNVKLAEYASRLHNYAQGNVSFLDINDSQGAMKRWREIVRMLCSRVLQNSAVHKTLRYIELDDPVSETLGNNFLSLHLTETART